MLQALAVPAAHDAESREDLSYEAVYEEHFDFVWRNVRRLGVPESAADDAVQDVFVVVHRRLGEFEGRSSIRTWLFSILSRVARDHRRSMSRRARKADALAVESEGAHAPSPADVVAKREAARVLDALLAELDDEKRAVLVLVELEQMSVADVAEALDVNVNTTHARLRAARQQFEAAAARFRAKEKR